jgi:hypothetical protein
MIPVTVHTLFPLRNQGFKEQDFPQFSKTACVLSQSDFGERGLDRALMLPALTGRNETKRRQAAALQIAARPKASSLSANDLDLEAARENH